MCGPRSLESVLWEHGPLSDSKPSHLRGVWEPAPQMPGILADLFPDHHAGDEHGRTADADVDRDDADRHRLARHSDAPAVGTGFSLSQ